MTQDFGLGDGGPDTISDAVFTARIAATRDGWAGGISSLDRPFEFETHVVDSWVAEAVHPQRNTTTSLRKLFLSPNPKTTQISHIANLSTKPFWNLPSLSRNGTWKRREICFAWRVFESPPRLLNTIWHPSSGLRSNNSQLPDEIFQSSRSD